MRLRSLFLILCVVTTATADDVVWLADVNTPPVHIDPQQTGRLDDLLLDVDGQPIASRTAWMDRREQLRNQWREFLGPMPDPRPMVKLQLLKSEAIDGVTRQLIRYECEPSVFVEAYLIFPVQHDEAPETFRSPKPLPAIVALHPTTDATIDEISGVSGRDHMHSGLKLAQRGFVVICPRCFLWQNAPSFDEAVTRHRQRHPTTLGMARMLYDAQRAVDVLETLPCVDRKRIGAFGHSLGAKEVLYLAAFDDRVQASVFSEGGLGFRSTNWDAPWYLGAAIHNENFVLNHHQLVAMIAPRPFLVMAGEAGPGAADGDRSWAILKPSMPAWRLCGEPLRLGLLNHREGHVVSEKSFELACEWLMTYLGLVP